jgi:N-formylmaleamate deformylase
MTHWMTGVCETNGINIHYLRTGRAKPPLLLLHGLTGAEPAGLLWRALSTVNTMW